MPLDDATVAFIERASASPVDLDAIPLAQFRAAADALIPLGYEREEVARVSGFVIDGPGGEPLVLRLFVPEPRRTAPVVVWAHGGSFVRGSLETHDTLWRAFANRTGCAVLGVGMRLAPEHPFPAQLDDLWAALGWAAENGHALDGDGRLILAGDSSGGMVAAAAAIRARDDGGLQISGQLLVMPLLDGRAELPSMEEFGKDYLLTSEQIEWAMSKYAPGGDFDNPLLSPLRVSDASGLPPAVIATAEYDPLRDHGEVYAAKLERAGVPVRCRRITGVIHHSLLVPRAIPRGAQALQEIADEFTAWLDDASASGNGRVMVDETAGSPR